MYESPSEQGWADCQRLADVGADVDVEADASPRCADSGEFLHFGSFEHIDHSYSKKLADASQDSYYELEQVACYLHHDLASYYYGQSSYLNSLGGHDSGVLDYAATDWGC